MAALRLLWFNAIVGIPYSFPLTVDRLQYEFAKDLVSYLMLTTGVLALHYLMQRYDAAKARPEMPPSPCRAVPVPAPPERFAVRKRGGSEVLVEMADIDWIEARATTPSCMSAARPSRSVPRSASSRASSIPSAS